MKAVRVGTGESSASATDIYIQIILVSQHSLPQNGQLKKYGDQKQHQRNHESLCHIKQPQEKLQVNLLFFPVQNPVISDLLLSSYHFSI